jgi:hypothetical protein
VQLVLWRVDWGLFRHPARGLALLLRSASTQSSTVQQPRGAPEFNEWFVYQQTRRRLRFGMQHNELLQGLQILLKPSACGCATALP